VQDVFAVFGGDGWVNVFVLFVERIPGNSHSRMRSSGSEASVQPFSGLSRSFAALINHDQVLQNMPLFGLK
jgi:hypothetical protein